MTTTDTTQPATATHTPGPWTLQPVETHHNGYEWPTFAVRSYPANYCLAVVGDVDRATAEQNAANARLIAAAPELLAALREMTQMCAEMLPKHGPCGWGEIAIDAARAAIAKAECAA